MSRSPLGLRNIGPVSESWLRAAGINSLQDLERIGSVEAYRAVRMHGFNASLNLLYALEAALLDTHWTKLPERTKERLKQAAQKASEEE